jgi:hypothetical protein
MTSWMPAMRRVSLYPVHGMRPTRALPLKGMLLSATMPTGRAQQPSQPGMRCQLSEVSSTRLLVTRQRTSRPCSALPHKGYPQAAGAKVGSRSWKTLCPLRCLIDVGLKRGVDRCVGFSLLCAAVRLLCGFVCKVLSPFSLGCGLCTCASSLGLAHPRAHVAAPRTSVAT